MPLPRGRTRGQGLENPFKLPGVRKGDLGYVPTAVFSPGQANQLGNAAVNQISVGAEDRIKALEDQLAGTGATGALLRGRDDILAGAAAESAGARTAANIQAAQANAAQANARGSLENEARGHDIGWAGQLGNLQLGAQGQLLQRAALNLQARGQDIDLNTEEGRQNLQRELANLQAETATRQQDIDWLQSQLSADVAQRGQDVAGRSDLMSYLLGGRGQDISSQSNLMSYLLGGRGQDIDAARLAGSLASTGYGGAVTQRGQDVDFLSRLLNNQNDQGWRNIQMALQALGMFQG